MREKKAGQYPTFTTTSQSLPVHPRLKIRKEAVLGDLQVLGCILARALIGN